MGLSIPEAISLFSGLPLETCERASQISGEYVRKYPPTGGDMCAWYRRKWDLIAAAVGIEATVTFCDQEHVAVFGGQDEYGTLSGWLDEWKRERAPN